MKKVIVDISDITDSVELYESKPNPFMIYTIYTILLIFLIAVVWASFFKIDDVVNCDGLIKGENEIYSISSGVSGEISECNVINGQYINKGDILYIISVDDLGNKIEEYQKTLDETEQRIKMLEEYKKSLDSENDLSADFKDNKYYEEFSNRRKLLYASINYQNSGNNRQAEAYQGNASSISDTIEEYNSKVEKLEDAEECILNRNNTFNNSDSYYYSLVNGYISTYELTAATYDSKIAEYQTQIDLLDLQIENADNNTATIAPKSQVMSTDDLENAEKTEEDNPLKSSENDIDVENLKTQKEAYETNKESVAQEKAKALKKIEETQISNIEQTIEGYKTTIINLSSNKSNMESQLVAIPDNSSANEVAILTEKQNVDKEILDCQAKKDECESYLNSFNIKNDKCVITAQTEGYYYSRDDIKVGSYIQEGSLLGNIYPEQEAGFYIEIYVRNSDIGHVVEGQDVKFEISAFPAREYGYVYGKVENISKDITVNEKTGMAYYIVKVKCCENDKNKGKKCDIALKTGMACRGNIIVGEKTVMTYLLEKINLTD